MLLSVGYLVSPRIAETEISLGPCESVGHSRHVRCSHLGQHVIHAPGEGGFQLPEPQDCPDGWLSECEHSVDVDGNIFGKLMGYGVRGADPGLEIADGEIGHLRSKMAWIN